MRALARLWIPAYAGMTVMGAGIYWRASRCLRGNLPPTVIPAYAGITLPFRAAREG